MKESLQGTEFTASKNINRNGKIEIEMENYEVEDLYFLNLWTLKGEICKTYVECRQVHKLHKRVV